MLPPSPPPPLGANCERAHPLGGNGSTSFSLTIPSTAGGTGPDGAYNDAQCTMTSFSGAGEVFWLRLDAPPAGACCASSLLHCF